VVADVSCSQQQGTLYPLQSKREAKKWRREKKHSTGKWAEKHKRDKFLKKNKSYIRTLIYIGKICKCQILHSLINLNLIIFYLE